MFDAPVLSGYGLTEAPILTMAATTDSEILGALLAHGAADTSLEAAALELLPNVRGAFCLTFMDENTLYAARDPYGVRPLSLGRLDRGWVVASETAALDIVGASFVRDIDRDAKRFAGKSTSGVGTGGMISKLEAARRARLALAFAGASTPQDQRAIDRVLNDAGAPGFAGAWLLSRHYPRLAAIWYAIAGQFDHERPDAVPPYLRVDRFERDPERGREADPPSPSPRRCFDLGAAVARIRGDRDALDGVQIDGELDDTTKEHLQAACERAGCPSCPRA